MADKKIYEVRVRVTEITEEKTEGSGYSKITTPAQATETATIDIKDYTAEDVLIKLQTIIPSL